VSISHASLSAVRPAVAGWRVALALAATLAALAAGSPAAARLHPEDSRHFPWRSTGGLLFYVDAASFPGDSAGGRTEFYVRIPGSELVYRDTAAADSTAADSAAGSAEVSCRLRVKDAGGRTVYDRTEEVHVPPRARDASGFSLGHVLLLSARLASGWHEVRVDVSDLRSQRRGLAYLGRRVHLEGKAEGVCFLPPLGEAALRVSEVEPAWSIRQGAPPSGFSRGPVEVVPNPSRTYGLYQPTARAYYEVALQGEGRPLPVAARVLDPTGKVRLVAQPDSVVTRGDSWGQVAFDVSTLGAGAYDLEVAFGDGPAAMVRRMRMNVAWRPRTWQEDPRQLEDEIRFLLDDQDQEDAFGRLSPGEQEAFLDGYWARRDPDPATAANEERQRFEERVAYADEHFGTKGMQKGMLSDRGRIYIRYGEPDEVRREVMPTQGLQVDDLAREIASQEGNNSAVRLKGRGLGGDMRSFEIWYYDRLMHPEVERREGAGPRRAMQAVFVFVDEEGYGDYVLRYSTE
jgi:GWxTD domain-containing protein